MSNLFKQTISDVAKLQERVRQLEIENGILRRRRSAAPLITPGAIREAVDYHGAAGVLRMVVAVCIDKSKEYRAASESFNAAYMVETSFRLNQMLNEVEQWRVKRLNAENHQQAATHKEN